MRKISSMFFVFFLLLGVMDLSAQLNQDWKWQNPIPQGNTLRWVKYWDANNWYAIGYAGTFMKTTNAGTTWTFDHKAGGSYLGYTGQGTNMYDAYFFNQNTGVVVGSSSVNGGIVRTTNGGTSWDTAYSSTVTTGVFYQVQFLNNNVGYAVGTVTPKIWKTVNGGITWTGMTTAPTTTVYDIYAFDTLNLIISTTSGNVQKSTDGGATWSAVIATGSTGVGNKIHFTDNNKGYLAGASGKFAFTTDGGASWTLKPVIVGATANTSSYYDISALTGTSAPATLVTESFDGATFPPTGWSNIQVSGTGLWTRETSGTYPTCTPHTGAGMTSFASYNYSTGVTAALISPAFSLVGGGTVKLGFWMYRDAGYATTADRVVAMINDSASATFADTLGTINRSKSLFPVETGADGWYYYEFTLPAGYTGATNYVILKAISEYGNNMFVDDISVIKAASTISKIYLTGDAFYIYKTQDNGTTWDTVGFLGSGTTQPWTSTYYATSLSSTGDTLLTVGANGFFNRRLNASNTQVYSTIKKLGVTYDIWAQNSSATGLIIGVGARTSATGVADQVIRSTNGGTTWNLATFPTSAYGYLNSIHMIDNNTGWACGSLASLFKTTNGGASWDSVATPFGAGAYVLSRVQFINANTGWVFSKSSMPDTANIIKTTDGGATWTKQRIDGASSLASYVYWADMVDANTGYAVNYTPNPVKTTNGGVNWIIQTKVDAYSGTLFGIDMIDANTGYMCGGGGRIYKTTNGGTLWDTLANKPGSTSPSWYGIKFYNPWVGVAVGSNGMTIMTSNGGINWTLQNTAGGTMYNVCIVPGSVGYTCGTSGYIWKNSNLPLVSGIQTQSELPIKYELSQNYPNPFNPTTTIKFAIPKAGLVTIKVYDVSGREVVKVINNQYFNAGYQSQVFTGTMLASGVYFYSLVVDNNLIDTKKMVLVK
jgi:photosystem II stability/assembly factor-like uncharacterized protein